MAIPSEGAISVSIIAQELGTPLSTVSLRSLSNVAGFFTPDSIGEFRGYSAGISRTLYFAITNNVSRLGGWFGSNPRMELDGNGYELYKKPNSSNTDLGQYILLSSYIGDAAPDVPIYDRKGQIIGYESGIQYTYSNRKCITNVTVDYDKAGNPSYVVTPNTRGDEFYINLVQPYI